VDVIYSSKMRFRGFRVEGFDVIIAGGGFWVRISGGSYGSESDDLILGGLRLGRWYPA